MKTLRMSFSLYALKLRRETLLILWSNLWKNKAWIHCLQISRMFILFSERTLLILEAVQPFPWTWSEQSTSCT
ncbi:hypothetical protein Pint_19446 [Pistacia integerrima]|uniref:Uncharacterized protein n=1 Tax=Pistacia integerrima TaxID=434235 RepID=A0ACC0Z089_9ROSI|nr:hypothetical protein Pint_19446 [Pistacia integerrima]